MNLDKYSIKDATYLLSCSHCISSKHRMDYFMKCIPISKTKSGKIKIIVFGERNWKGREHIKKIRYVDPFRLYKRD